MSTQDRFAELWTDYLEGELDESGIAELRNLLEADERLTKLAADLYQTHRLLGLVADDDAARHDAFVRDTLDQLPDDKDSFVSGVMSKVTVSQRASPKNGPPKVPNLLSKVIWTAVALVIVGITGFLLWPKNDASVVENQTGGDAPSSARSSARFASLAHAKFFGELLPPVNSSLAPRRDYVLMSGLVEVTFPAGASAIIEGPAVFRVLSDESLALDVGRCSVHAPDGAEGFHVETPITRVVDRGTRFTVSVAETSETEVQVIEGAADVYRQLKKSSPAEKGLPAFEVRLTTNEAQKFAHVGEFSGNPVPFNPGAYQGRLPDRVIAYKAATNDGGLASELRSVTVQRDGKVFEIPVDELIPSEVTWFKGQPEYAYIASDGTLPKPRSATSSDRSLLTGVINPGGSREPLTSDPVMNSPNGSGQPGTPGLAVRFQTPVVNGPGADVVFFDLQTFANPPDGDAFHVSPLTFRDGLKSHTIRVYDLTMESPAALGLADFQIHMFEKTVQSLDELDTAACTSRPAGMRFRGLVVGIDLSDLGYGQGETVEGLFFQDTLDDQHIVDPVFIGGLPDLERASSVSVSNSASSATR